MSFRRGSRLVLLLLCTVKLYYHAPQLILSPASVAVCAEAAALRRSLRLRLRRSLASPCPSSRDRSTWPHRLMHRALSPSRCSQSPGLPRYTRASPNPPASGTPSSVSGEARGRGWRRGARGYFYPPGLILAATEREEARRQARTSKSRKRHPCARFSLWLF